MPYAPLLYWRHRPGGEEHAMSDEQSGSEQSAQPESPAGDHWGDPIRQERQAELKTLAARQREWAAQPEAARGESAFKNVPLTEAEVSWLAEDSGPDSLGFVPNLHLEQASLSAADLEGAYLVRAHL